MMPEVGGRSTEDRFRTESHYIDTPEHVALEYSIAGIGSRFVAMLLDSLIIGGVFVVELLILVVVASATLSTGLTGRMGDAAGKWFVALILLVDFAILWGYFALFEAYWHGQTPGKRVMKLRVIKDSGRQITLFESMARNLLRVVDYLPSLYLTGVITMLCTKRSQRVGDLVAATLVVHERLDEGSLLHFSAAPDPMQSGSLSVTMFPADAVARLQAQDLVVIETFFARMLDLPMATRSSIAYRMVAQMASKMGVAVPEGNPERALESLAYQMRRRGSL
jgi:uncharacterized RDD family membrane protein YckC